MFFVTFVAEDPSWPSWHNRPVDKPVLPHQIRQVYTGRIFTVAVESVTLPNGHALDVEVVRHPGSVVLLPITESGEVVLVRQYRHPVGRWTWELPAGSLKRGEDPEKPAARASTPCAMSGLC